MDNSIICSIDSNFIEVSYIYVRKEFSARKWIYSEPISIPKEEVFLLKNLINIYLTDLNYSKEELLRTI